MTADDARAGPPTGHADLDTLADLHAGVLGGPEVDRLREHLAGCRQCAATVEALDAVQGQLRSLPAPAMPAAVGARLDAALAELRPERPVAAGGSTAVDDELERARLRRGRRLSRVIGAVAAAVVVIAGGGVIASIARGGGTSETASSAGGGSAVSAPAQPKSDTPAAQSAGGDSAHNDAGDEAALPAYDRASLRAALPTIAAQGVVPRTTALDDPARRSACAESIPGAAGSLRGVQHIRYEGRPAYVFVYADGDRLTGFVVSEACGTPGQPVAVFATVS